jgi:bisphosphoglycerate-dependent phosphoglycerate mutase
MNEEYTDDQIEEWTREDLLNPPLLSDEEIQELRKTKENSQHKQPKNSAN